MLIQPKTTLKRGALLTMAILLCTVTHVWAARPSEERRAGADERFRQADSDGNGMLSKDEAARGTPWIAKNFDAIDADKDSQVTRDEIRAFAQARRKARCAEMK